MIRILEVNNIDLPGRVFNGYNMIDDFSNTDIDIKQIVVEKQSNNDKVIKLFNDSRLYSMYYKLIGYEEKLSVINVFSITTPALLSSNYYKEADIIHFHMFHNTRLSLYSLIKMSREKKIVITLHDPFFITGHCVHFYDCNKWKNGCVNCNHLDYFFPFVKDNAGEMWKLKKYVFDNSNIDIVVSSKWMYELVKTSPIFESIKNVHLIPYGININGLKCSYSEARKHYGFKKDDIVLFLRAQSEFKGTEYILEALKLLDEEKKVSILTCDNKGMLNEIKDRFNVIDLGVIDYDEIRYAMNACDIFLMPSKGESFGFMAVEAMSCSKPVVVFNNSALPSVTHAPECGFLVKNKNVKELCKAIEYLIDHPEERERRGKIGRNICIKEYNYDVYKKAMKKMYLFAYNRERKIKKTIVNNEYVNNDIKQIFEKIKNNDDIDIIPFINYSNPDVQEYILKMNEDLYNSIINNKIHFCLKDIIKSKIKSNSKVYSFLKKILRK